MNQFSMNKIITFLISFLFLTNFSFSQTKDETKSIYPYFSSCKTKNDSASEIKKCSEEALLSFFNKNIEYPPEALKNKIEGTVYIRFSISEDGTSVPYRYTNNQVDSILIQEVFRVFHQLPKWVVNPSIIKPWHSYSYEIQVYFESGQYSVEIEKHERVKIISIEELKVIILDAKKRHKKLREERKKLEKSNGPDYEIDIPFIIIPHIPRFPGCEDCLLYTSPSPRDATLSRMPSSA